MKIEHKTSETINLALSPKKRLPRAGVNGHRLRILLISCRLPPDTSGSARTIYNLSEWLEPDEVVLLGSHPEGDAPRFKEQSRHRIYRMWTIPNRVRGSRYLRFLLVPLTVLLGLYIIVRYRRNYIVACFGDDKYLLAGYILYRLTHLPFSAYFHDLYRENKYYRDPIRSTLAQWLEPRVFRHARVIFALTPGIYKYYREKRGLNSTVLLRHCLNLDIPDKVEVSPPGASFLISFSGSVSQHNYDCLRVMREVVKRHKEIGFVYFTPVPEKTLKAEGVMGVRMKREFKGSSAELLTGLRTMDLLYLPLTFSDVVGSAEIEFAFPTKVLEYLISGRPILVHCPSHYSLSRFFLEHDAALVVNSDRVEVLESAVLKLCNDAALRQRLVDNALITARFFHGQAVVDTLRQALWNSLDES